MNEQIQKELLTWLTTMREAAQQGAGFAIEQAPQIAREAVAYGRAAHVVGFIASLVGLGLCVYLVRRYFTPLLKLTTEEDWDFPVVIILVAPAFVGMFMLMEGVIPQGRMALLAWFAPRLYIIEWLARLVK